MKKKSLWERFLNFFGFALESDPEFEKFWHRNERGFPFSDLVGLIVGHGEESFVITPEMEKSAIQRYHEIPEKLYFWYIKSPNRSDQYFEINCGLDIFGPIIGTIEEILEDDKNCF
ncbi:MAG: hypothetical protein WC460_00135 [Patescibacteria group bacterium]